LESEEILTTPLLRTWAVELEPPPDAAVAVAGPVDTVIQRGSEFTFQVAVYNTASTVCTQIPVEVSLTDPAGVSHPFGETRLDTLPPSGIHLLQFHLSTTDLPARVRLTASLWGGSPGLDRVGVNNMANAMLTVAGERSGDVRFFVGGRRLVEGDYIPPGPELTVVPPPPGSPPMTISAVNLMIDGTAIPNEGSMSGEYFFRPLLSDGGHRIETAVLREGMGVKDTVAASMNVRVERKTRILQALAYPSPFAGETAITFTLTGTVSPDDGVVRIFTVAGRKVREIAIPGSTLNVGFNRVSWDGRDAEGDDVANGLYFFQLSVRMRDGARATEIGKVARVR
jgi:hypothetical protein